MIKFTVAVDKSNHCNNKILNLAKIYQFKKKTKSERI